MQNIEKKSDIDKLKLKQGRCTRYYKLGRKEHIKTRVRRHYEIIKVIRPKRYCLRIMISEFS